MFPQEFQDSAAQDLVRASPLEGLGRRNTPTFVRPDDRHGGRGTQRSPMGRFDTVGGASNLPLGAFQHMFAAPYSRGEVTFPYPCLTTLVHDVSWGQYRSSSQRPYFVPESTFILETPFAAGNAPKKSCARERGGVARRWKKKGYESGAVSEGVGRCSIGSHVTLSSSKATSDGSAMLEKYSLSLNPNASRAAGPVTRT